MSYIFLVYSIFVILSSLYLKKKKLFSNYTGDDHQLFSNKENIPLIGGMFLIVPIILINQGNATYLSIIILISLVGFFSDKKILISPTKRFFFQLLVVFLSVFLLHLEILSSRIIIFDNLLDIKVFNLIFTSFCLLILINGSNFIDGLNGLLLVYITFVIIILFKLDLISKFVLNEDLILYLIAFLIILIILNLLNILMLGDTGAYLLSFFLGYLIINCHKFNPYISPYFFISIIWYPCYENLFSIIRKLKEKFSPLKPDSKHLHQLLYSYLRKKYCKKKLFSNNVSSLLINIVNLIVIYISSINPYSSIYQIKLIIGSIFIYTITFMFLQNKTKKNE